jgi:metal-responsive CopG/Arc/MetJ family transcriptional regulator
MTKKTPRLKMGRSLGQEPTTVIHIRLPNSLLTRIDTYVEGRQNDAEIFNRAIMIRQLLEDFLREEGL